MKDYSAFVGLDVHKDELIDTEPRRGASVEWHLLQIDGGSPERPERIPYQHHRRESTVREGTELGQTLEGDGDVQAGFDKPQVGI